MTRLPSFLQLSRSSFTSWYLGIRLCGSRRSSVYLLFVVVAAVLAMLSVHVSIKQLNFLSSNNSDEEGFGDAKLDAEFAVLKEKYKGVNVLLSKLGAARLSDRLGLTTARPVEGEATVDAPEQQKEKELLDTLTKVKKLKLDISKRERREELAIAAVKQLYFEDPLMRWQRGRRRGTQSLISKTKCDAAMKELTRK